MADVALRIAELTGLIGAAIPADYAQFLQSHRASQVDAMVSTNPDYWGVSAIFELGGGPDYYQTDATYRLVRDVLPAGTLPVAQDIAGNLYLLDCNPGAAGEVLWWDHEREVGDDDTEFVAPSFTAFFDAIVPAED